jgi:1,4-dihydroxy-2-naphthoate polyprenyltransferase
MASDTTTTASSLPAGAGRWFLAIRPKTLPAAAVPVLIATALAERFGGWDPVPALLCLAFALLVQVGTNLSNDYFDFLKGADTPDRLGPRRMVATGAIPPRAMFRAAALVFAASFLVGINLVWYGGWWLVLVGGASILFGYLYTAGPFPLAYVGLGDLFVFIFFGLVAVVFTFFVQAGFFLLDAVLAGAAIGALAVAILVVNNYRDRSTDARAGKRTLAVRFGRRFALAEYAVMGGIAAIVPFVFLLRGYGAGILLPLLAVPAGGILLVQLGKAGAGEANRILARTAGLLLGYGLLLAVGILIS